MINGWQFENVQRTTAHIQGCVFYFDYVANMIFIYIFQVDCSNNSLFCYLNLFSCFKILFPSLEQVEHNFMNLSKPSFCSKGSKSVSIVALIQYYRTGRIEIRVSTTSIFYTGKFTILSSYQFCVESSKIGHRK